MITMDHLGNSSLRSILWKPTNVCLVRKVMWLLRNFSTQRSCICGTLRPPLRPLPRPPLRPPQSAVAVHIALCLPSPLPTTLLATLPECTHRFSGSLASCWFGTRASMSRTWEGGRGKVDVYPLGLIRGCLLLPKKGQGSCLSPSSGIFLSWVQIKQYLRLGPPGLGMEKGLSSISRMVCTNPHVHPAKVPYAQPANHPSAQSVGVPLLPRGAPTMQTPAEPLALL